MAYIDQLVNIAISIAPGGLSRAGFGVANFASFHTAFTERIKFYSDTTAVALDFSTTSPEYLAAVAYFLQEPAPNSLAISRLQQDNLYIDLTGTNAYDDTHEYKVTVDGVEFTSTAAGTAALTIDALKTAIDAGGDFVLTKGTGATPDFVPVGAYKLASTSAGTAFKVEIDLFQDWMTYLVIDLDGVGGWVAGNEYKIAINDIVITVDSTADANIDATITKVITAITTDAQIAAVAGTATTGIYYAYQKIGSAFNSFGKFEVQDAYQSYTHGEYAETWTVGLGKIKEASNQWYGLAINARSEVDILLAAAWTQTNKKLFGMVSDDLEIINTTVSTDTGSIVKQLYDLGYTRTITGYHSKADGGVNEQWADVALFGENLTVDLDVQTTIWAFSQLIGITVDDLTDTQIQNATGTVESPTSGKNCNVYIPVAEANIIQRGQVIQGEWIDTVIGIDWTEARMQEGIYAVLIAAKQKSKKVPYIDRGIVTVVNEVIKVLKTGQNTEFLDFNASLDESLGFSVTWPLKSNVSTANLTARILKNVKFVATLAGAIQATQITGTIGV